jgi:hypothetical protein
MLIYATGKNEQVSTIVKPGNPYRVGVSPRISRVMIPLRPKRLITAVANANGGVISGTRLMIWRSFLPLKFNFT